MNCKICIVIRSWEDCILPGAGPPTCFALSEAMFPLIFEITDVRAQGASMPLARLFGVLPHNVVIPADPSVASGGAVSTSDGDHQNKHHWVPLRCITQGLVDSWVWNTKGWIPPMFGWLKAMTKLRLPVIYI